MTHNLEYETPPPRRKVPWDVVSLVVGLLGCPATIAATAFTHSLATMASCAAVAIGFSYFAQGWWKGRFYGQVGVILTLLWAPLLLVWSLIFLIRPL